MSIPKLKLLSSSESADLVGVSIDTICQYKELGLLRVQKLDGVDYFEEDDVKLIFNSRRKEQKVSAPTASNQIAKDDQELPTLSSILKEESVNKDVDSKVVRIHADKYDTKLDERKEGVEPEVERAKIEELKNDNNSYLGFDGPSSIEILELSRSLKQQLELVMSERDWLRQRVEKLELQLERQQMISMFETETLRLLAKGREPSPSLWSLLLSWTQPKENNCPVRLILAIQSLRDWTYFK